jgi:PAS domain S-box-containing protein
MQHSGFMPHGICYLWKPELVWLHVVSDAVTALAYYAIPPALLYLVLHARRQAAALGPPYPARGLPYEWVYVSFGLFIVACGTTHLLGVWNVWHPSYWLSGGVKAVTALASVATAIAFQPLVPRALALFREARLSELQHRQLSLLAAIVEHSDDAILTKDLTGRILTWNRGAERLYGYSAEELVGESLSILLPPDRQDELTFLLGRITAGESVTHHETTRLRKDGSVVHISLSVSPVRNAQGQVVAASAIARDVTAFREARERELRLAQEHAARTEAERLAERLAAVAAQQTRLYEEAAAINHTRSEFLAVMSHELRTPLNAIIGYADLLDAGIFGSMTEAQQQQLERIRRSGDHLRNLIDQILGHARLEAGRTEPRWQTVQVRSLLDDVIQLVAPAARERQLEITTRVPARLELETDPNYLRQILSNLLSNAVKFTEQGSISAIGEQTADELRLTITDTGIGIASEHLDLVFEPFWQVGQGRTRPAGGTGLGLAVARRLAARLGGSIQVRSGLGQGTSMILTLPLRRA